MVVGDVVLDTISRQVSASGRESKLTSREFRVLECLMESVDRTVTKAEILDVVWGADFDVKGTMSRIKTIRGVGYVFPSGV